MESEVKDSKVAAFFDGIVEEEDPRYFHLFKSRLNVCKFLLLLFPVFIFFSILYNQFGPDSDLLSDIDQEESINWDEDTPERGAIYSDTHDVLAIDVLTYSLRFDPMARGLDNPKYENGQLFQNNYKEFAAALSHILKDKSPREYEMFLERLYKDKPGRNILLTSHRITPSDISYLKSHSKLISKYDENKSGVMIIQHSERKYPNGNIAKRTIGLNSKNGAVTGLEKSMDYRLAGRKGTHKSKRVTSKLWISQFDDNNIEPQDGWDVVTTINLDLQKFVQDDMVRQIRENDADWGTAIVLDVATGDIKAIANVELDHNTDSVTVEKYDGDFYAIHQRIEPGSTFKTVVFTALIELKHLSLNEMYNTGGGTRFFPRGSIKVVDDHTVGNVTFKQVLEQSSNVGMAMAVERHCSSSKSEMQALDNIIRGFGILNTLDLDIPTSIQPVMRTPEHRLWSYSDFITQSFGYAVNLTPMHIAMFYNAIANNGVMVKPRFVTSFEEGRTHRVISEAEIEVLNPKLCSPETLSKVQQSLEGVVLNGTAKRKLAGCKFQCAGKTGTAKISQGRKGYDTASGLQPYFGSFVGYFPVDKPRYTVFVGYKTMHRKGSPKPWSGAMLSAPVFKNIADYIYDKENSTAKQKNVYVVSKPSKINASIGNTESLKLIGDNLGFNMSYSLQSSDEMVGLDSVGVVVRKPVSDSTGTIDLKGYSLTDALVVLHLQGIKAVVVGEGIVYRQEMSNKDGNKIVTLYLK